jgi:choline dehydrogenase-like flavoprotein
MIDAGYLSDQRDIDALWIGWRASLRVKQRWFEECSELLPGLPFVGIYYLVSFVISISRMLVPGAVDSKYPTTQGNNSIHRPAWFSSYVAEFANPYYHWCGTCIMGEDIMTTEGATAERSSAFVVDERMSVRGVRGLRVCDASVFPGCISAPTALTCAALGRWLQHYLLRIDKM